MEGLITVTYNNKEVDGELHIVPAWHDALLGKQWIRGLEIELRQVSNVYRATGLKSTLLSCYSSQVG